jgi:hypothetical protein
MNYYKENYSIINKIIFLINVIKNNNEVDILSINICDDVIFDLLNIKKNILNIYNLLELYKDTIVNKIKIIMLHFNTVTIKMFTVKYSNINFVNQLLYQIITLVGYIKSNNNLYYKYKLKNNTKKLLNEFFFKSKEVNNKVIINKDRNIIIDYKKSYIII